MKHKHAELMALYAQDATETVMPWLRWEMRFEGSTRWFDCDEHPRWSSNVVYRRKTKTININGHEVPEPVREPLARLTEYWVPWLFPPDMVDSYVWTGDTMDQWFLSHGLVHLTLDAVEKHEKALLSFTEVK